MKLTGLYFKMCVKRSMQYRLDFILLTLCVAPIHLIQMLFSWFIAKEFDGFGSWSGWDLIFLYGLLLTSYSIAQIFCRRLRMLEYDVIDGNLDVYFTRPLPILYSIICNDLRIVEIFAQLMPSVIVLILSCVYNQIQWNGLKVLVLIGAILGGAIIQMVLFLLIGSVSFWTVRSGSLASIFYAFKDFLNYPLYVYGEEVLLFLTYILPMAFINYYPALYILEKEESRNVLNFLTFPVSLVLAGIAVFVWKKSLNHYNSTGS